MSLLPAVLMLMPCILAAAVTELPSIIGPGMVVQRDRSVPVWGWDAPGAAVTVSFRGREARATAGADGRWEVQVATGVAGGPFPMVISGSSHHELADILVGEVWIAGGQSNMWWQLRNCADGAAAVAAADLPMLRWYDANTGDKEAGWPADRPARTVATRWVASHPSVAADFAGTAFHFARRLQAQLGVPVGIVHLAVPGTAIEQWLSAPLLRSEFPDVLEAQSLRRAAPDAHARLHAEARAQWSVAGRPGADPGEPDQPVACSALFNGMVAPCAPYAARGFLWWQGEGNAGTFGTYRALFPALVGEWRGCFGLPDAPFLFVELAGFGTRAAASVEDAPWPAVRDAQRSALRLPGTAMVCTLDILDGYSWEIHPPRKELAGERLFRAAHALAYGGGQEWSGPQPAGFRFIGGEARIAFTHAEGMRAREGALEGFALAGADRTWHAATARIDGAEVVVASAEVRAPVAVRYAWRNNPRECNLVNGAGLPACAFRSDDWPLCLGERAAW